MQPLVWYQYTFYEVRYAMQSNDMIWNAKTFSNLLQWQRILNYNYLQYLLWHTTFYKIAFLIRSIFHLEINIRNILCNEDFKLFWICLVEKWTQKASFKIFVSQGTGFPTFKFELCTKVSYCIHSMIFCIDVYFARSKLISLNNCNT